MIWLTARFRVGKSKRAGAVSGFGTTARLLAGALNLSKGEAKARAEQAGLLTSRRSLTGEALPALLPAAGGGCLTARQAVGVTMNRCAGADRA